MMIEIVLGLLLGIIVVQQVFFMWQIHKLVNKLMSRDFHSYNHTVSPPVPMGGFNVHIPDEGPDRLKELNKSFQMPL